MQVDRNARPEVHAEREREWVAKNRGKAYEYRLKWKRQNRQRVRGYELKRRYGITTEQRDEIRERQGQKCAVCRKPLTARAHTDHDHKTGRIRGILCGGCNIALGFFEKPGFYDRAMAYLRGDHDVGRHTDAA